MDINEIIKREVEVKEGFMKHNNFKVEELKPNYARISVEITDKCLNPSGIAHGGLIFGLADSVMGMAAITNGKNAVTVNSQIDYIKAGKGKKLIAIAEPLKVGRTISVYEAKIYNEKNDLIATVKGTYYFKEDMK